MKIGKEALSVAEKYVWLFVKEAIARSRQQGREKAGLATTGSLSSDPDWLQVEDLEKISPQLLLDF